MRIIENFNSLIRFVTYLMPLFVVLFGRGLYYQIVNKLKWHQHLVFEVIYILLVVVTSLFAIVAIYKLFRFGTKKRRSYCIDQIKLESNLRIARLAEEKPEIEQFFLENHDWVEKDLDHLITKFAKDITSTDFGLFRAYVNEHAVLYFSHRVTDRKQFLNIINNL